MLEGYVLEVEQLRAERDDWRARAEIAERKLLNAGLRLPGQKKSDRGY